MKLHRLIITSGTAIILLFWMSPGYVLTSKLILRLFIRIINDKKGHWLYEQKSIQEII